MKKAALLILCFMATVMAFAQKDLNSSQLKLRTEIFNFLKEEGFTPEIDKDGDIKFKRQGNIHYVVISENNESPMYVEMERYVPIPEKYSEVIARIAAHNLSRRYKAVKCYLAGKDKVFTFSAQMFVRSSEPFKEVFYKLCAVIDDMKVEMNERLEEAMSGSSSSTAIIPLSIGKIEIANVYKDGTIETEFGETLYSNKTMYFKPRITYSGNIDGKVALKTKWFKADGTLFTGDNSSNGFSQEVSYTIEKGVGKTLVLSGWGNEEKGFWKAGKYRLEIWYENTCLKTCEFEVEEKKDNSKQLYMNVLVEAMEEEFGGFPATISVGKINVEIVGMETVAELEKVITVFRMPKSLSSITGDDKKQMQTYCESFCLGVNLQWKNMQSDLMEIGLENLHMVYRLEDKYGVYIDGERK